MNGTSAMNNPRVIVLVSGGVVTGVASDAELDVDVCDHDNAEMDEATMNECVQLEAEGKSLPYQY
jgi:hypothetical protein